MVGDCKYSLQKVTDRAYEANEEMQREYIERLLGHVVNLDQLVFVDESQKNIAECERRRTCSVYTVAESGLTEHDMAQVCGQMRS